MRPSISIRPVTQQDAPAVSGLMQGLGFDHSVDEIAPRLNLAPDRTTDPAFLAISADNEPVGLRRISQYPNIELSSPTFATFGSQDFHKTDRADNFLARL